MKYNPSDARGIVTLIENYDIPARSILVTHARVSSMYNNGSCIEFEPSLETGNVYMASSLGTVKDNFIIIQIMNTDIKPAK